MKARAVISRALARLKKRPIDERTKGNDDAVTPEWLINRIATYGAFERRGVSPKRGIGLDPAGQKGTPAYQRSQRSYLLANHDDGLRDPWRGYGLVFCNPPYGRAVVKWAKKAIAAFSPTHGTEPVTMLGDELIMLVAARVNSRWFRALWRHGAAVLYFDKRLRFGGEKDDAKFPSAIVYFGQRADAFAAAFGDLGTVLYSTGPYDPRLTRRAVVMRFPAGLPAVQVPTRTPGKPLAGKWRIILKRPAGRAGRGKARRRAAG